MKQKWNDEDRQRFADGDRLKAKTIPPADKPGTTVDDWSFLFEDDTPLECGLENPENCEACQ